MKFYICPSFSKQKSYYSLFTSFLLLFLSINFIYYKKGPELLQFLLCLVGIFSVIHHSRSFSDEYNDFICILDRIFANLLGIYILFLYQNNRTFGIIIFISFLFVFIQNKCQSPKNQSFLHSFIHILVCMILILNHP